MTDKKTEEIKEEKPSPEGKEDLRKKLEETEKQKAEYLAGWQRERADFLNYKKEEMERIGELLKYAMEEYILKLLPILDNFEKAEKELSSEKKKDKFFEGVIQIKNQLHEFLRIQGVEEVKSQGEKFDPNMHEVIGETEVKGKESGLIVEEIQKGYKVNGHLLRPARVKIIK